jgi:hypothetical protein
MSLSSNGDKSIGSSIQDWWSKEWTPANKQWVQICNKGYKSEFTRVWQYDDEFSKPPQLVSSTRAKLRFRLLGKSSAKWWKDWMVLRIIPDLKARFPAVGKLVSVGNCE